MEYGLQYCDTNKSMDLPSISEIESNLYLGNIFAANDASTLTTYKITHIVTVDIVPLLRSALKTLYIHLSDQCHDDILGCLQNGIDFIQRAISDSNGTVLLHCRYGISRSAAFTIAFLMQKYSLNYEEAFERVHEKRPMIAPNRGFIKQLQLYHEMNYRIDANHDRYKRYRLSLAAVHFRKFKILLQTHRNVIRKDPGLVQAQPDPHVYRCRKCRRVLAVQSNRIMHNIIATEKEKISCSKMYFFEPLSWMNTVHRPQGKLLCPKCNCRLGSFSWISGCQCPCGVQVAPAFYLVPSKVDYSVAVKNVEAII